MDKDRDEGETDCRTPYRAVAIDSSSLPCAGGAIRPAP